MNYNQQYGSGAKCAGNTLSGAIARTATEPMYHEGYANKAACEPRNSPASNYLAELHGAQNDTLGLVARLSEVLAAALAPEYPLTSECGKDRCAPPSPICSDIENRIYTQSAINTCLRSIIDRVTV